MDNYKLILLKDGRNILVSDEEVNEDDFRYEPLEKEWYKTTKSDFEDQKEKWFKVIGGIESLPTLTYSDEVKQILRDKYGCVDVIAELEKIFKDCSKISLEKKEPFWTGKCAGIAEVLQVVKTHQSITNKMFSLEDMRDCYIDGTNEGALYNSLINDGDWEEVKEMDSNSLRGFYDFINSLKQPIELNVEIEMKDCDITDCISTCSSKCKYPQPKITNNSIIINKIK